VKNTAEHKRITSTERGRWAQWGTYVGARAWGTAREKAPAQKDAWQAFPFEQARSRAYRWTEDGIGGFSDAQQRVCMAVALWNERDPILKERYFGLSNDEGNHGESVKEYYFYLDGVPSYSSMKMLYKYPQVEFPYARLVQENALRGQDEPAFELIDALPQTFAENRYFDIYIAYAKADADDILLRITAVNRGSDDAPLHVLPHLWFRNTWGDARARPELRALAEDRVLVQHPDLPTLYWHLDAPRRLLFTENDTHTALLYDQPNATPYVKDGIDYAVVRGQVERVNPDNCGTKAAAEWSRILQPGETWTVQARLSTRADGGRFGEFDAVFEQRQLEADEFYDALQPDDLTEPERAIQRTAFAALNWNRNFYHFNVAAWLDDTAQSKLPEKDKKQVQWKHFDARDIISIPDSWEFPWLAGWDFAFQVTTLCIADAEFAKQQIVTLLSDRYMRRDGALPAFENDLTTPHPPIPVWAAWHIYQTCGRDADFLNTVYPRLQKHFEWWMKTQRGKQSLFGGGFLGADNISVIDRNKDVPEGGWLAQVDGTGWMLFFALHLLAMAIELGRDADSAAYLKHFAQIRKALATLWDEETHFFYDALHMPDGRILPLKTRSLAGITPFTAHLLLDLASLDEFPRLRQQFTALRRADPELTPGANGCYLLTPLTHEQMGYLLAALLDQKEFYSLHGLRSVSKLHKKETLTLELDGKEHTFQYEPGESSSKLFGGNSNWRGPIWAPMNQLMIETLYVLAEVSVGWFTLPDGKRIQLERAARGLVSRLVSVLEADKQGHRPYWGKNRYFQTDPHWRDLLLFYEHFHGENGAGLGASHQNGWTALVARLIQTRGRGVFIPHPLPRDREI